MANFNFERERRKQRRFEQIGTDKPRCPDCPETHWRCFLTTTMPRCANCTIKATVDSTNDVAKCRRLRKLGTKTPCCAMCGESDWRCIELHHVGGRRYDPTTVLLCANDHLRMSYEQKDHPSMTKDSDQLLVTLNNFLRGLADMLRIIKAV